MDCSDCLKVGGGRKTRKCAKCLKRVVSNYLCAPRSATNETTVEVNGNTTKIVSETSLVCATCKTNCMSLSKGIPCPDCEKWLSWCYGCQSAFFCVHPLGFSKFSCSEKCHQLIPANQSATVRVNVYLFKSVMPIASIDVTSNLFTEFTPELVIAKVSSQMNTMCKKTIVELYMSLLGNQAYLDRYAATITDIPMLAKLQAPNMFRNAIANNTPVCDFLQQLIESDHITGETLIGDVFMCSELLFGDNLPAKYFFSAWPHQSDEFVLIESEPRDFTEMPQEFVQDELIWFENGGVEEVDMVLVSELMDREQVHEKFAEAVEQIEEEEEPQIEEKNVLLNFDQTVETLEQWQKCIGVTEKLASTGSFIPKVYESNKLNGYVMIVGINSKTSIEELDELKPYCTSPVKDFNDGHHRAYVAYFSHAKIVCDRLCEKITERVKNAPKPKNDVGVKFVKQYKGEAELIVIRRVEAEQKAERAKKTVAAKAPQQKLPVKRERSEIELLQTKDLLIQHDLSGYDMNKFCHVGAGCVVGFPARDRPSEFRNVLQREYSNVVSCVDLNSKPKQFFVVVTFQTQDDAEMAEGMYFSEVKIWCEENEYVVQHALALEFLRRGGKANFDFVAWLGTLKMEKKQKIVVDLC